MMLDFSEFTPSSRTSQLIQYRRACKNFDPIFTSFISQPSLPFSSNQTPQTATAIGHFNPPHPLSTPPISTASISDNYQLFQNITDEADDALLQSDDVFEDAYKDIFSEVGTDSPDSNYFSDYSPRSSPGHSECPASVRVGFTVGSPFSECSMNIRKVPECPTDVRKVEPIDESQTAERDTADFGRSHGDKLINEDDLLAYEAVSRNVRNGDVAGDLGAVKTEDQLFDDFDAFDPLAMSPELEEDILSSFEQSFFKDMSSEFVDDLLSSLEVGDKTTTTMDFRLSDMSLKTNRTKEEKRADAAPILKPISRPATTASKRCYNGEPQKMPNLKSLKIRDLIDVTSYDSKPFAATDSNRRNDETFATHVPARFDQKKESFATLSSPPFCGKEDNNLTAHLPHRFQRKKKKVPTATLR